jgi:Na+-transporting methylmalonyl-CoA/oxaloacetate decarboxylase gamma subunit
MVLIGVAVLFYATRGIGQQAATAVPDVVQEAQKPRTVESKRPEQQKSNHDQSNIFGATNAPASSSVLETQPDQGKMLGFDFARDPLNAKKPMQPAEEIIKQDVADKPKVTSAQQQLLQRRYNLTARLDPSAKISRGKPLPVGPTARLQGTTRRNLAKMAPEEIRKRGIFPYPSLPHPKHAFGT